MKSAWIIEWDCGPGKRLPARKIVAVFPGRTSAGRVVDAMRILEMAHQLTAGEHVYHASHRRRRGAPRAFEPVPADRFGRGFQTSGNPWLYGHLVKNVRVVGEEPDTGLAYDKVHPSPWELRRAAESEADARTLPDVPGQSHPTI